MFRRIVRYSNKHFGLFEKVGSITDGRIRPQIATKNISTSILSMMLSNLGSLNRLGSAASLGALDSLTCKVPSASTIARVSESIHLDTLRGILKSIYLKARRSKMIGTCYGKAIGIIDGHEITSSYIPKCSHCRVRNVSKIEGKVKLQYYHSFVAFILAGEKFATMLDIEPILPGQGELTSSYRLISRICANYPKAFEAVVGDALYLAGKVFSLLSSHSKYAIAVLKDETRELFEETISLSGITQPIIYRKNKTDYRVWEHKISGLWKGYKSEVKVIKSEETKNSRSHSREAGSSNKWEYLQEKTDWMWVTNLPGTGDLKNTVRICHSRWQIENQCFNETAGTWNADHIYRHNENAILAFILFLFIAVNIVNIFFHRNIRDGKIKTKVFLLDMIKASFLLNQRSLRPPNPIPI